VKRDSKLIRQILEFVEGQPKHCHIPRSKFNGYTAAQVVDHEKLCEEAGYLESKGETYVNPNSLARATVYRLTWAGHDTLAGLRKRGSA